YEAAELSKKGELQFADLEGLEKNLRVASYYEPKRPDRHRALGDFYLGQQEYREAANSYEEAFTVSGGTDLAAKRGAAGAYFGLGEFKNSHDAYTVVLEKNPKDVTLLKLRAEASQKYVATLDATKEADQIRKLQAELDSDTAMAIALGAKDQKAELAEMEKQLSAFHEGRSADASVIAKMAGLDPAQVTGDSKEEVLAMLEGLGEQYLQLAEQKYADPKDVEFVRGEL